jgi:hypothetical protein
MTVVLVSYCSNCTVDDLTCTRYCAINYNLLCDAAVSDYDACYALANRFNGYNCDSGNGDERCSLIGLLFYNFTRTKF